MRTCGHAWIPSRWRNRTGACAPRISLPPSGSRWPGRPVAQRVRRTGGAAPRVFGACTPRYSTVGCATCRLVGAAARLPVAGQVTSLELFFDLVFVFTITQLTATVLPGGWAVTGRTALLLLILWWMYGGYAWLTNAAPPVTPRRRILLVLGMIGLFVTAMAIPHAYGSDRVVFACGYLVVVVVHAGMYVSEAARITRGMVVQLLGWNMARGRARPRRRAVLRGHPGVVVAGVVRRRGGAAAARSRSRP